jgi:hypothetical protein
MAEEALHGIQFMYEGQGKGMNPYFHKERLTAPLKAYSLPPRAMH